MLKTIKIFDIDYLTNAELTDEDLHYLFDTNSLHYSLIKAQFDFIGINKSNSYIKKSLKINNDWLINNHFKNFKELNLFKTKITKAIKNIYWYSEFISKKWVDEWMFRFGFNVL